MKWPRAAQAPYSGAHISNKRAPHVRCKCMVMIMIPCCNHKYCDSARHYQWYQFFCLTSNILSSSARGILRFILHSTYPPMSGPHNSPDERCCLSYHSLFFQQEARVIFRCAAFWLTVRHSRSRTSTPPLSEPFHTQRGPRLTPPRCLNWQCRCYLVSRLSPLGILHTC
jgi:hypothetical protein